MDQKPNQKQAERTAYQIVIFLVEICIITSIFMLLPEQIHQTIGNFLITNQKAVIPVFVIIGGLFIIYYAKQEIKKINNDKKT